MSNVVPINQKALSLVPRENAFSAVMTVIPPKKKQFGGKKPRGTDGYVNPRRTLTEEELARVMEAAKDHKYGERDYCLILMAYRHALRNNELNQLHWSQINLAKKEIYIYRSKGGQPNIHPLADDEIKALDRLADHRGYVFKSVTGGHLEERAVFKIVQRAGRKAGLDFNIGTHIFRHTKITQLVRKGIHPFTIQNFAGHQDIKTTMRYVHEVCNDFQGLTDD